MKRIVVLTMIVGLVLSAPLFAGGKAAAVAENEIVLLMPSTTNNYLQQFAQGFDDAAAEYGYTVKRIENNFKQEEQDVQVQQQIAAKQKPTAYVWWPADNKAGLASLRALAATDVPVIMTNQLPVAGSEDYWVAYAGVDDVLNGYVAGKTMLEARDALTAMGHKLHSSGGNCLIIRFPVGYSAGDDRIKGFEDAIKGSGIQILDIQPAGFDETTGYDIGSQMIAANRAKGIDMFYCNNDALALGVIQALEEAGYEPGKDVMVTSGTCHGNMEAIEDGRQFASGLQPARLEGYFTMLTVHKYLANGTTKGEVHRASEDPETPPAVEGAPAVYNFIPNPPIYPDQVDTMRLWGFPVRDLCNY
jgi:ribose transport system substrate-binding protein